MNYILVVEDDADSSLLAQIIFEDAGYQVEAVDSVKAALARIFKGVPDLILLDYMLPDATGLCLLEQLKQNTLLSDIPVIMATADSALELEELIIKPDKILYKPIDFNQLLKLVEQFLKKLEWESALN